MKEIQISSGRSFPVPSLFEIQGEQQGMKYDEFLNSLVDQIKSFFETKVSVGDSRDAFKKMVFANWIYTSLFIDEMLQYLLTGSGDPIAFIKNIEIQDNYTQKLNKLLEEGKMGEEPSGFSFQPEAIQEAWNNYESDKMTAFYNFAFNFFYKDLWLMPLIVSLKDQYAPSSILYTDLIELAPLFASEFNVDFGEAFSKFELSLKRV